MSEPLHTPPCPCPRCGKVLDCVASAGDEEATPKEGDVSVCIHCGLPLVFDAELKSQGMTEAYFAGLDVETKKYVVKAMMTVLFIKRKKRLH